MTVKYGKNFRIKVKKLVPLPMKRRKLLIIWELSHLLLVSGII